jgi:hypothetical protein
MKEEWLRKERAVRNEMIRLRKLEEQKAREEKER